MRRQFMLLALGVVSLSCCAEGERISVPPLPEGGGTIPYAQVLARLAAQTNGAKEEYFLNHWDGVVDAANGLEQSAKYLVKAPDLPAAHKAVIEKSAVEFSANVVKLREAGRRKDQAETLELLRRLHNEIRDLQDLK